MEALEGNVCALCDHSIHMDLAGCSQLQKVPVEYHKHDDREVRLAHGIIKLHEDTTQEKQKQGRVAPVRRDLFSRGGTEAHNRLDGGDQPAQDATGFTPSLQC